MATAYVAGPSLADAVREHGPWPAAPVLALAAGLAEGPAHVVATAQNQRTIRVSWTDTATDITGFTISNGCGTDGCNGGALNVRTGPATAADITTTPGSYQCFYVQAINSAGASAPSGPGCISTPATAVLVPHRQVRQRRAGRGRQFHRGHRGQRPALPGREHRLLLRKRRNLDSENQDRRTAVTLTGPRWARALVPPSAPAGVAPRNWSCASRWAAVTGTAAYKSGNSITS